MDSYRVSDTLGCDNDKWDQANAYCCENPARASTSQHKADQGSPLPWTGDCDFRKEATRFISELMRMGRSNRELAEIQNGFSQFAMYARLTLDTDLTKFDRRVRDMQRQMRQEYFKAMVGGLSQLQNSVAELMLARSRFYNPGANDAWDKLKYFMEYRLNFVRKNYAPDRSFSVTRQAAEVMMQRTEPFTKWAKDLVQSDYSSNPYYRLSRTEDAKSNDEAQKIYEYHDLAQTMVALLNYLGEAYFHVCRRSMRDTLSSRNPFDGLTSIIGTIRSSLPHNRNDFMLPQIWPEKGVGTRG